MPNRNALFGVRFLCFDLIYQKPLKNTLPIALQLGGYFFSDEGFCVNITSLKVAFLLFYLRILVDKLDLTVH